MYFNNLANFGNQIAVITDESVRVSYLELDILCKEFAKLIPERALVIIELNNSIESLVAYLSCLQKKAVALLLDDTISMELLTGLIENYKPNLVFSRKILPYSIIDQRQTYTLYKTSNPQFTNMCTQLSLLLPTSGSTGSPKLVRLSANNLQANAESIAAYLKINSNDRPITTLPMSYSYGLSIVNSHLLAGATLLMTNHSVISKEFWLFTTQESATSFAGVPYTYKLLQRIGFDKMHLPALKCITQAGGKLDAITRKYLIDTCVSNSYSLYIMYGQTEATARISYLPPDKILEKPGSIGIPIPNGKLSLVDENFNVVTQPNVNGEIIYTGRNVMLGYANSLDDLSYGDENQGLLATGDTGYFDADGFFYITGRKKRFIKLMGKRINLDEIQDFLASTHEHIICHGNDDELMIGFHQLMHSKSEIKELITRRYKIHPTLFKFYLIKDLVLSSAGKLQYHQTFEIADII